MLLKIIIGIHVILFIFAACGLIISLYISSLPSNKQDEALNNIENKFNNFWK